MKARKAVMGQTRIYWELRSALYFCDESNQRLEVPMRNRMSLCWCGLLFALGAATASAANFSVTTFGTSFSPSSITINTGDTVTWNNLFGHTVTGNAANEPFCGTSTPPTGTCSVTFNTAGTFTYRCIPHAGFGMTGSVTVNQAATPPAVNITNPPGNSLFAAPASVGVGVQATDADGNVVSVQVLTNGVAGAMDTTLPFSITLSNLAAGNYAVRARATDNQGLSATSPPVTIRVVNRPALSFTRGSTGPVELRFNTVAGVNYVIEESSTLTNFSSIATNAGNGGVVQFLETNAAPGQNNYRLRLQL
jgi:plastocyanin